MKEEICSVGFILERRGTSIHKPQQQWLKIIYENVGNLPSCCCDKFHRAQGSFSIQSSLSPPFWGGFKFDINEAW